MLPVVIDTILPFLFEEEKVPLLLASSYIYSPYRQELLDIRADYHSLVEYHLDRIEFEPPIFSDWEFYRWLDQDIPHFIGSPDSNSS